MVRLVSPARPLLPAETATGAAARLGVRPQVLLDPLAHMSATDAGG
ncbi:MAG: hypothetical protein ACYDH5_15895 [Acidimicrobiales bacterium]